LPVRAFTDPGAGAPARRRSRAGFTLERNQSTKSRTSARLARSQPTSTAARNLNQRSRSNAYDRHDDAPDPHANNSFKNASAASIRTPAPSSTTHGSVRSEV
jgi:hypothetical protein